MMDGYVSRSIDMIKSIKRRGYIFAWPVYAAYVLETIEVIREHWGDELAELGFIENGHHYGRTHR